MGFKLDFGSPVDKSVNIMCVCMYVCMCVCVCVHCYTYLNEPTLHHQTCEAFCPSAVDVVLCFAL